MSQDSVRSDKSDRYTYAQFLQALNGTGPVGGALLSVSQYVAARAGTVAKQFNFQWLAGPAETPGGPAVGASVASKMTTSVTGTAPGGRYSGAIRWGAATSGAVREVAILAPTVVFVVTVMWYCCMLWYI